VTELQVGDLIKSRFDS